MLAVIVSGLLAVIVSVYIDYYTQAYSLIREAVTRQVYDFLNHTGEDGRFLHFVER